VREYFARLRSQIPVEVYEAFGRKVAVTRTVRRFTQARLKKDQSLPLDIFLNEVEEDRKLMQTLEKANPIKGVYDSRRKWISAFEEADDTDDLSDDTDISDLDFYIRGLAMDNMEPYAEKFARFEACKEASKFYAQNFFDPKKDHSAHAGAEYLPSLSELSLLPLLPARERFDPIWRKAAKL